MRSLVALAVQRRVTVFMTAMAIVAFGFVGYQRLSLELFPDINYPSLTVQTEFPDTAPQEVENLVTRPIEETVGVLRGLQNIHSVSRAGVSEVTLEFDWDSDMDLLSMEVREKLDRLVLPEEAEDPIVLRFDPSLDPIMRLALSGPGSLAEVRRLADRKLKPDFETVAGIAAAEIKGGLEEEIHVDIQQNRMAALNISIERVRQVVGASNVNLPGGSLRSQETQYLVRTINEFDSVEEIANLIVAQTEAGVVRLKDVATVTRGSKEREVITRVNGVECVEIAIYKEGDANTVSVARLMERRLGEWREDLPPDHTIIVLFNQAHFIKQAINEVRTTALIGGALAILVLFAFLRDVRSTLIIATSIPLSVIATFMMMYRMNISLNIMSLGGLTLGIGMLVDNSIVVLESIFRKKKSGLSLNAAAIEGTTEVGPAVIASTLTTVAVFLPIVFVEGIAGQLFKDQAMTVTISLLASLIVAVTMIPMLSAIGGKVAGIRRAATDLRSDEVMTMGVFSRGYDRFVRGALRRRVATLAIACGLFFASLVGVRYLGTELIPQLSEGEFFFEATLPEGTALAATDRVVQSMEAVVAEEMDEVDRYYSTIGSRLIAGGMSLNTKAENLAQLNIAMKNRTDERAEIALVQRLRSRYTGIPDLEVKFGRPAYFSLKTPVEIILYGDNLEDLRSYSLEITEDLQSVAGLVDIRSSLEAGNPELQVIFDRRKLAQLGLDMAVLSQTLKNRVQGVVPTRFKDEDRQIDIRIRNQEDDRRSVEDVRNLVLPGPDGRPIRLLSVADVRLDRGPAEIHRLQQQRAAMITANVSGASLGAVVGRIGEVLDASSAPPGVTTEIGGQNEEMQVSFASLKFALILAIFLVYLVMAAVFESFVHPFIVLFTIPLALVGVVGGLMATGTTITVIVLIGTIMLVGVVVNNAIVLIDAINRLRRAGMNKMEAVIRAGHVRLRPIVMTSLTTILALLPMTVSWGEGSELRSPLAITVAAGLLVSTLLTLIVIPAAYMIVPSRPGREETDETPIEEEVPI